MQRGCLPPGVNTDDANPIPAIRQDREHNLSQKRFLRCPKGDNRSRAARFPGPCTSNPIPLGWVKECRR